MGVALGLVQSAAQWCMMLMDPGTPQANAYAHMIMRVCLYMVPLLLAA